MHEWMDQAECRNFDPELFFPTSVADTFTVRRAKEVCDSCQVQAECSIYREQVDARVGIWHGHWYKQDDGDARATAVELSETGLSLDEIAGQMNVPKRRVSAWLASEQSRKERLVIREPEVLVIPAQVDRRGMSKVLSMLRRGEKE